MCFRFLYALSLIIQSSSPTAQGFVQEGFQEDLLIFLIFKHTVVFLAQWWAVDSDYQCDYNASLFLFNVQYSLLYISWSFRCVIVQFTSLLDTRSTTDHIGWGWWEWYKYTRILSSWDGCIIFITAIQVLWLVGQERQISRVWFILIKVAGDFLPLVVTYSNQCKWRRCWLPVTIPAAWFISRPVFSLSLLIQGWIGSALCLCDSPHVPFLQTPTISGGRGEEVSAKN